MTRLPALTDEPARTIAVLAIVAKEIRRHLGGRWKPRTFDPVAAARSLEAAGLSCVQPLPDYKELKSKSASIPPPAPEEVAADASQPTATSPVLIGIDEARTSDLTGVYDPMNGNWGLLKPDFSPDFSSHVEQPEIIRRTGAAKLCGVSLDWFDRNIENLITTHQFPAPRDPTGQRRWHAHLVLGWAESAYATDPLARARRAYEKTKRTQND